MASVNSAVAAKLAAQVVVRKNEYRGNPQFIDIFTDNGASLVNNADVITFTGKLPANCKVLGVHVKSAGVGNSATLTFKVGTTTVSAALAIGSAIDAFYAFGTAGAGWVDGSGLVVTGTVGTGAWDDGANDLFGHIVIVTDE